MKQIAKSGLASSHRSRIRPIATAQGGEMNSLPRFVVIGRPRPAIASLLIFCSVCVPRIAMAQAHSEHVWGYRGSESPAHWGDLNPEFAACKTGHRQSPINIGHTQSAALPAIQFEYKPTALHIINN